MAHPLGVVDVLAEDDRLLHTARGPQVFAHTPGDQLGALVDHQRAVEVAAGEQLVGNRRAVAVDLALPGPPAVHVAVQVDADDLVRGEETIGDPLAQRIGVDRLAEVVHVGDVFGLLRGGGQPDLCGRGEVVQHLAPGRVGIGAAAVTLVHDDQVEEVGRKLAIDILPILRPRDALVEGEVDFVGFVHLALDDFGHLVAEEAEVVGHGLVDQDVPIGQVEDASRPLRPPQPPDDLKRGVGLAGAGRHHQQDASLPLGDGAHRPVDRHLLVVARLAAIAVVVIILRGNLRHLSGHARLLHDSAAKVHRARGIHPIPAHVPPGHL